MTTNPTCIYLSASSDRDLPYVFSCAHLHDRYALTYLTRILYMRIGIRRENLEREQKLIAEENARRTREQQQRRAARKAAEAAQLQDQRDVVLAKLAEGDARLAARKVCPSRESRDHAFACMRAVVLCICDVILSGAWFSEVSLLVVGSSVSESTVCFQMIRNLETMHD